MIHNVSIISGIEAPLIVKFTSTIFLGVTKFINYIISIFNHVNGSFHSDNDIYAIQIICKIKSSFFGGDRHASLIMLIN